MNNRTYLKNRLLLLFAAVAISTSADAGYELVEDFEALNVGGIAGYQMDGTAIVGSPNSSSPWRSNSNNDFWVGDDGSGVNQALNVIGSGSPHVATYPGLTDIADGTTATIYFRLKLGNTTTMAGYDMRLGVSVPPPTSPNYFDPPTGVFLKDESFKAQDESDPLSFAGEDGWWNFWLVIDNTADTYTVYCQKEGDLLPVVLSENETWWKNNVGATDALTDFYLFRWNGPSEGYFIDDIYIDTSGINLDCPAAVQAEFMLLDDFGQYALNQGIAGYDLDGVAISGSANPTSAWKSNDSNRFKVIEETTGGNKLLEVAGNSGWDVASLPSMPDIHDGTTATVYFRLQPKNTTSGTTYDTRLGASGPPPNSFNFKKPNTGIILDGSDFNGQGQAPADALSFVGDSGWRHFWIVVDNSADTYTVYTQGSNDLLPSLFVENKGFDNALTLASGALTDFYLYWWQGPSEGYWLDDLCIDLTGANLSVPSKSFLLIEDFEEYQLGSVTGYNLDGTPISDDFTRVNPLSPWRSNNAGEYEVATEDFSVNQVLNARGAGTNEKLTLPALPDIAEGEEATIYYRLKMLDTSSTASYDMRVGPSIAPNSDTSLSTGVLIQNTNLKTQNGWSGSTSFQGDDHWYHVWVHVDNQTNKYSIYYLPDDGSTNTYPHITLAENVSFSGSIGATDAITDFGLFHWVGPDVGYYIDDIHIYKGANNPAIPGYASVQEVSGASAYTLHSQNDTVTVNVRFSRGVVLSEVGGAQLSIDINGTKYNAIHAGNASGLALDFQFSAPIGIASKITVDADSLELLNGATLQDFGAKNVKLSHRSVTLDNERLGEGALNVYDDPSGLSASPHYSYRVRKVGGAWETPFAWFTKCEDYDPVSGADQHNSAYYARFIGSWSNTYCNFEMDPNTPIEVEITKLDGSGNPVNLGASTPVAAHPSHKVSSCTVVGGKVIVTLSNPALFAVDIDGKMDDKNAPRATEGGWGLGAFPYRTPATAIHTVTVFANAFITGKPDLSDPTVFAVNPGDPIPDNGKWRTLYFKPGIHDLTELDNPNEPSTWKTGSPLNLRNGRNYYIPGDAMVYGNLNDYNNTGGDAAFTQNIRVYGHGTLSGEKIPHFDDHDDAPLSIPERHSLEMLSLRNARNCFFEGITVADQAEHGAVLWGRDIDDGSNYAKWMKALSWRVNNDGMTVTGNSYLEDGFIRHQDDGSYIKGMGIRRMVYWSDVNGAAFRLDSLALERDSSFPASLPQNLIIEDIDIIYARGVFAGATSRSNGIFTAPGGGTSTANTGQHVIFRDIRYSDPNPYRNLIGLTAEGGSIIAPLIGEWAGVTFEDITMSQSQVFGWRDRLWGTAVGEIRNFLFDNVTIDGTQVDASYVSDPTKFETNFSSGHTFQ